jgi:DNA-damage-inducible protein J
MVDMTILIDNVNQFAYNEIKREGGIMATVQTQIRIDEDIKREASDLLNGLGLNLSDAVNMYLRQVILQRGIPFEIKYPEYKDEVITAMKEAKQISHNPDTKRYNSFGEALEDIENEI